jgi:hypothetical protein
VGSSGQQRIRVDETITAAPLRGEAAVGSSGRLRHERDELVSPPDAPSRNIRVPYDIKGSRNPKVQPVIRKPPRGQPSPRGVTPVTGRDSCQSGNHRVAFHDLSGRAERIMSGRINSRNPTVNSRYARTGVVRFGLRNTTDPQSTESQRASHRGTCCNLLQIHRELSLVYVTARTPRAGTRRSIFGSSLDTVVSGRPRHVTTPSYTGYPCLPTTNPHQTANPLGRRSEDYASSGATDSGAFLFAAQEQLQGT